MKKSKEQQPSQPSTRETSGRTRIPTAKLVDPNNADANKAPQSLLAGWLNQPATVVPKKKTHGRGKQTVESSSDDETGLEEVEPPRKIAKVVSEKNSEASSDKDEKSSDLEDLGNVDIDEDEPSEIPLRKTADIDAFFSEPSKPSKEDSEKKKKEKRKCKLCSAKIVNEPTTCRRHIQAYHVGKYYDWIKKTPGAVNRLPKHRAELKAAELASTQPMISEHFSKAEPKPHIMPYSNDLFKRVALEWIIATSQPIHSLDHPKFQEMIDVASRAKDGVIIPGQKATRSEIMRMFRDYLYNIKNKFNGKGKVSFTCDAWQASNADGYFAVTAHWIEERAPLQWELKAALIGFTRMNESHTGEHLSQALFKLIKRVGLINHMGWITSDNASNNQAMMRHFAQCYLRETGKLFKWEEQWIRCLAHVINLSVQDVLKKFSSAAYAEDVAAGGELTTSRDEVGLIRTMVVKIRSSSQRKEKFLNIQRVRINASRARMIPPDMKVRWSSTYVMLHNAYELQQCLELFVGELAAEERDAAKKKKLQDLNLSLVEWQNVKGFIDILKCADDAQQAFSSETFPSMHLAIPALEALHAAWKRRLPRAIPRLAPALEAGMAKLESYYNKTEKSDAYLMAMVLDPDMKMKHFRKYWGELYCEVEERIETIFSDRYLEIYGSGGPRKPKAQPKCKIKRLLTELNDTSEDDSAMLDDDEATKKSDAAKPWLKEFKGYLEHEEMVYEDISTVTWWGRNSERYPVWASLAADYLAIMASSVSSERAFSAGGIVITKRRNRLKGDIVEALQVLKCAIQSELLVRPPMPSSILEDELTRHEDAEADLQEQAMGDLAEEKGNEALLTVIVDTDEENHD